MSVLIALAARAVARVGALTLGSPARRAGTAALAGLGLGTGVLGIPGVDLFPNGNGKGRRRRRRKMFTDGDLAQFAAAGALVSKGHVAALMMIRAAKA